MLTHLVTPFGGFGLLGVLWIVLVAAVHIAFAIGVSQDSRGKHTELVTPTVWIFATLIGGVFVATAYWFIHYFRKDMTQ